MLSANELTVVDLFDVTDLQTKVMYEWCSLNLGEGGYCYWGGLPTGMSWMWSWNTSPSGARFWFRHREHATQFKLTWL
jgi:hypothetical protein